MSRGNKGAGRHAQCGLVLAAYGMVLIAVVSLCGCSQADTDDTRTAGKDTLGPWWMQQTALTRDGKLGVAGRDWWDRAMALKLGDEFTIEAADGRGGGMLVRRETAVRRTGSVEAIVWVIDDDADGSVAGGGDLDSDCYVVDYGPDGIVDRMVDYVDNDGDQRADEMDIRYFEEGELRSVWCGLDLDGDGHMWDLAGYEYSADFFKSDPYGNNMIYMNKFDPRRGEWVPVSECPFAFYDTDGDGQSEVVVRVSAVPLVYDAGVDPDYANDAGRYRGAWSDDMERMGVVNIRYSFDIDNLSGPSTPLHYDFGFNLVGSEPYRFAGMDHFNPKRRPPQVTRVIPHESLRAICDRYQARETGFSWREQHDDTIALGAEPRPDLDYRWEGIFWMWERRFMENTGGPCQKWNMRREWSDRPASRRELYYSGVDRRIHLVGAREGWIEIGNFAGVPALGEVRMLDADGNGYFDRWEVYQADSDVPVRVTAVRDEQAERITFEDGFLHGFYTDKVLPEALAANERMLAAMGQVHAYELPSGLRAAMTDDCDNDRRYAQDVAREMHYQELRQTLTAEAREILRAAPKDDLRRLSSEQRKTGRNSAYAWRVLRALQNLDVAYGEGDVAATEGALKDIKAIRDRGTP